MIEVARRYTLGFELYDLATSIVRSHAVDSDEAVAGLLVLLLCWNIDYYRRRMKSTGLSFKYVDEHVKCLREAVRRNRGLIEELRRKRLEVVDFNEPLMGREFTVGDAIRHLFEDFRAFLGPTGASKVLHLLVPSLIVMWDTKIRQHYGLPSDGAAFLEFHRIMHEELRQALETYIEEHGGTMVEAARSILYERYEGSTERPITKVLDEYNWVIACHGKGAVLR